jgi:hypothetical protein
MVLLFGLFKATEWFIEHRISGGKDWAFPLQLGSRSLSPSFPTLHRRVEHAVSEWLNRAARTREHELNGLAEEVSLIRDSDTLRRRVVDRLDQVLGTKGSALYLAASDERFDLAVSTCDGCRRKSVAMTPRCFMRCSNEAPQPPPGVGRLCRSR